MGIDKQTKEGTALEVADLARRIADSETCELSVSSDQAASDTNTFEYTAILDLYDGLAYVCTHTCEVIRVSVHLAARLGGRIIGEKCYQAIHGLAEPCPWCPTEGPAPGETENGTLFNKRLDRWVEVATTRISHPGGRYLRVGIVKELNNQAPFEDTVDVQGELGSSMETRLRRSPAALFVWRAASGWPIESVMGAVEQYGYTVEELLSTQTQYSRLIHSEDRNKVASELGRHALEGTDDFLLHYRLAGKDGKTHPVTDSVHAVRHVSGFITHYETMVLPSSPSNLLSPTSPTVAGGIEISSTLFAGLFHNLPFGLLIFRSEPEDGLVLAAGNSEAARLAGIKVDEMLGARAREMWDNPDWQVVAQGLRGTLKSGKRAEINDFRHKAGQQEKVLRLNVFKIAPDHVALAMEDVARQRQLDEKLRKLHDELDRRLTERTTDLSRTNWLLKREVSERKTSEDALRQSELKYHTLLERLPLGVISCNLVGDVVEINPGGAKILGMASAQGLGSLNLLKLPLVAETGALEAISNCLSSGESFEGEVILRNRWGKDMYVRLHTTPIRATDGRIIRAHIIMEDVSDFREAQELLVKSERLKVAGKMTGGVAQTFSGLLQFITGEIQAALASAAQGNAPKVRRQLEELLNGTRDAAQRLRRLQQFARTRADTGVMLGTIFNLGDAVREASETVRQWSQSQPKRLGVDIALDLDLAASYIAGDRSDVVEVVVSLLKNAVEALPDGGKISVKTRLEDKVGTLQVQDNGVGVLKKDIETMFEPFWTTKEAHAGLGLAVSVGIIRRHGGRIVVRSRRGTGTLFTVSLPAAEPVSNRDQVATQMIGPLYFRILVIDPDDTYVRGMEETLRSMGQTLYIASTGEEGLQIFEDKEVDAVISELVLPDMNGWEISKSIQSICVEKGIPKPPLILLTSWARQLEERQIIAHPGINRILEKPISFGRLLEVIREDLQEGTMLIQTMRLKFD